MAVYDDFDLRGPLLSGACACLLQVVEQRVGVFGGLPTCQAYIPDPEGSRATDI